MGKKTNQKFVFGYGSLVSPSNFSKFLKRKNPPKEKKDYFCLDLIGFKRIWNIVRDNSGKNGYIQYFLPDGELPNEPILLINIVPSINSVVNGIAFKISDSELEILDNRERNYNRIDISGGLSEEIGKCFAYTGKSEAIQRYQRCRNKNFLINKDYFYNIENSFKEIGENFYQKFKRTTIQPDAKLTSFI
jgi:hypothetical protein